MQQHPRELAGNWLDQAKRDLDSARYLAAGATSRLRIWPRSIRITSRPDIPMRSAAGYRAPSFFNP
jgi:hypothetical protein